MAFNPTEGRAEYTASAGQTIFTFTFKIFNTSDIKAYLTPSGSDPDDTADLLAETTDYTVTINGDDGGDLTLVVAASDGDKITLVRELPVDRDIEFQKTGDFDADVINADQEYQTYLVQDSKVYLDRTFRIPDTAQGFDTTITTLAADSYFKTNAAGDGVEVDSTVPAAVITSGDYVLDAASWANEDEDVPVQVFTSGTGADRSPTVYSAKHWAIKAQDAVIGDVEFRDTEWRIFDDIDNTKKIAFQASGITTATTRTITMPDADVDLGSLALKSNVLELDNTNPFTPDADYEPATKKYVDDSVSGVSGVLSVDNFLHIQEQQTAGTSGGSTVAITWTKRPINTVVTNTITGASLASNQITLPAGTYYVEARSPGHKVGRYTSRIYNTTDAITELSGSSELSQNGDNCTTSSSILGVFTIAASKVLEFQYSAQIAVATVGLGYEVGSVITIPYEIFGDIKIWKVA